MEQIIYLEADDDIPVIRDRLEWAEADRVLLVVPPKNRVLRSLVNLKLLSRYARNYSLNLALVTRDPRVMRLSREIKLATFGSVERAQRSRWLSEDAGDGARPARRARVEEAVEAEEPITRMDLPERPLKDARRPRRMPRFRPRPKSWMPRPVIALGFLVLAGLVAGMMAVALVLIYPRGRIQITPATQRLGADLVVLAHPEAEQIDYASLRIPARLVQVEIRDVGSVAPETSEDVPADPAQATVSFVNRTDQPVTVPMSTTLTTSSGANVRFITVQTATVPAAFNAITQTRVIAVDPGPTGNVAAGLINRVIDPVLARRVSVINEAPATGGTVAPAGIVTRADKDRLQAIVLQQIQQEGYSQLLAGLAEQEFIPPESLVVIPLDAAYAPNLDGEIAEEIVLEMRAVVRGTAIGGQNANQLALAALQSQVPPGYLLDPRSLEFVAGEVIGVEERAVRFTMRASGAATAQIDPRQVAGDVRGLAAEEAAALLRRQFPLSGEPLVAVEPDWLGRLPWFPFRIAVEISEAGVP
jgi:hypothetical protein